jgi:hypothetical protein
VKKQIESIRPAIVQFSYDGFGSGQLHFGCGVIVSSDGHVAVCGPVGAVLDDRLLELITTDGRKLRGRALGWSSEYGVGMLKIDEPGQWKFVKLSDKVIAGETCLALGYPQNRGSEDDNIYNAPLDERVKQFPLAGGTVKERIGTMLESNTNAFANSQLVIETTKNLDGTWKLSIRINGTLTYEDPNFDVSTISKLSLQAHWGSGVVFNKMQVVKK